MKVTKQAEGDFKKELLSNGTHAARIFSVVDLGTQEGEYQGVPKLQRKLKIGFEVPTKTITYEKDGEEKTFPLVVRKRFTLSLADLSHLTPIVKSALGSVPEDLEVSTLIGKTLLINVGQDNFQGNDYNTIESSTPIPEGMEVLDAVNDVLIFDLDAFDQTVFDSLPEWEQKIIVRSPEYKALGLKAEAEADRDLVDPADVPF